MHVMFGYLFLIFTILLQAMSFAVVCFTSHRLPKFLAKKLKLMFVLSFFHFLFRLMYEICSYCPMHEYGMTCWTLRACIELTSCGSLSTACVIAGYYYEIFSRKSNPEHEWEALWGCVRVTPFLLPLCPLLYYSITYHSDWFMFKDSCWTGEIAYLLNICQGMDHAFILCILTTVLSLTFCIYRMQNYLEYAQSLEFLPDLKGKTEKVAIFTAILFLCEIPIQLRSFAKWWEKDFLVVIAWCCIGCSMSWCFCFLDKDMQDEFASSGQKFEVKFKMDLPEPPREPDVRPKGTHEHLVCRAHRSSNNPYALVSPDGPQYRPKLDKFRITAKQSKHLD